MSRRLTTSLEESSPREKLGRASWASSTAVATGTSSAAAPFVSGMNRWTRLEQPKMRYKTAPLGSHSCPLTSRGLRFPGSASQLHHNFIILISRGLTSWCQIACFAFLSVIFGSSSFRADQYLCISANQLIFRTLFDCRLGHFFQIFENWFLVFPGGHWTWPYLFSLPL